MNRLALVMLIVMCASSTALGGDGVPGRKIDGFSLRDYRGERHSLSDFDRAKLLVVAFLGTECPLANLYTPRLIELAKEYEARGVATLAIDSNRQDSAEEMADFAARHHLAFPFLKDPGNEIADRFAAQRTPQVFVLDHGRVIRYVGRIDDRFEVGIQRGSATRHDLALALDELLAGQPVSQPMTQAPGCFIGRVQIGKSGHEPAASEGVTWSREIARIFQGRCQECHRPGQLASFSLLSYEEVIGWAETIREVVALERMPPWNANPHYGEFANDMRLSAQEKKQIIAWVDAGAPEGNRGDLPEPRVFVSGWRIPKPDQVVCMSDEPFAVPAKGVVDYQWFYVNPGFQEDKWVRAVEARPGSSAVVHHITVYHKPPGQKWDLKHNTRINLLGGFNPGGEPLILPPGTAIHLPAGTELAFEMHYTPNGKPEQDRSFIGLSFAPPQSVRKEVRMFMPADTGIVIPPQTADYRSEVPYTFREDMELLVLRPHMHLRGKSFRYEARYPDGKSEILLDVPRFDFNWQHSYFLRQPKPMPRGTVLRCVAHFDNSPANPANPDPDATVRWGDQSWDEMMIGIFGALSIDDDLRQRAARQRAQWWQWVGVALALSLAGAAFYWNHRRRRYAQ